MSQPCYKWINRKDEWLLFPPDGEADGDKRLWQQSESNDKSDHRLISTRELFYRPKHGRRDEMFKVKGNAHVSLNEVSMTFSLCTAAISVAFWQPRADPVVRIWTYNLDSTAALHCCDPCITTTHAAQMHVWWFPQVPSGRRSSI